MTARTSMASLIAWTRRKIGDPAGANQQFSDDEIQDALDAYRTDVRYELLHDAPSIVNAASTGHQAVFIYADYYSDFQNWEEDVVLQGNDSTNASWVTLTPVVSDALNGHWQFETDVFSAGTAPGQIPPVYATGKIYDVYAASADLLETWAAALACRYDSSVNGQTLKRSQLMQGKVLLASLCRRQAQPRTAKFLRSDSASSTEDDITYVVRS